GSFHRGEVPFDLQCVAPLLRGPEPVGDDRDARAPGKWDLEYVPDAGNAASVLVVEALDARAEDGRPRDHGRLHAGEVEVEAELQRAVALGTTVEAPDLSADETEL